MNRMSNFSSSEIPNSSDCISRQAAKLKVARVIWEDGDSCYDFIDKCVDSLDDVPPAQPQYEELTPEEAASEIASGTTMSTWYWLDDMIRLNQMGYAICRKR